MTKLHVSVESCSTLVHVSVAKLAVQTLHSFEVNDFFEILKYNKNVFVAHCALFIHCAFVDEKS